MLLALPIFFQIVLKLLLLKYAQKFVLGCYLFLEVYSFALGKLFAFRLWLIESKFSINILNPHCYCYCYCSLNAARRCWGPADEAASCTSPRQPSRQPAALVASAKLRPVHSVMLSLHFFLGPPLLLPPLTVP